RPQKLRKLFLACHQRVAADVVDADAIGRLFLDGDEHKVVGLNAQLLGAYHVVGRLQIRAVHVDEALHGPRAGIVHALDVRDDAKASRYAVKAPLAEHTEPRVTPDG